MAGGIVNMDASALDVILETVKSYSDNVEREINDVLHGEAGGVIYGKINELINPSGRTWRGHASSAADSAWPRYDTGENLAVTVGTTSKFRYLYFPDDGSNTKRHQGNQQFFMRGADAATSDIVGIFARRAVEAFGG